MAWMLVCTSLELIEWITEVIASLELTDCVVALPEYLMGTVKRCLCTRRGVNTTIHLGPKVAKINFRSKVVKFYQAAL